MPSLSSASVEPFAPVSTVIFFPASSDDFLRESTKFRDAEDAERGRSVLSLLELNKLNQKSIFQKKN